MTEYSFNYLFIKIQMVNQKSVCLIPIVNVGAAQVIGLQSGISAGPKDQVPSSWHVTFLFQV